METKVDILNELLKELSFYMVEYESEEEIKNKIESYRQRWENAAHKSVINGSTKQMDISNILRAEPGACFHGEVWVRCPHCHAGNEMMGARSEFKIDDWRIYKCEKCGKYFKDK